MTILGISLRTACVAVSKLLRSNFNPGPTPILANFERTEVSAIADTSVLSKFAKIGVGPGLKFDLSSFDTATQAVLKEIPKMVIDYINEILKSGTLNKPVNGWNVAYKGFGNFGTDY